VKGQVWLLALYYVYIIKKKENIMRNVFITTIAALAFTGAALAQEAPVVPTPVLSGEVALDFAETAAGDIGGTMGLDLGVDVGGLATVDLDFSATDGNAVTLDNWTVGTTVAGVGIAIGDDNGLFPGAEGEQTLAAPAMTESLKVSVGDASVAVGFTDWTADVTDISNVQGAYTFNLANLSVTAAGDYNLDTENTVVGAGVAGFSLGGVASLGGAVTYDVDAEVFGYETVATAYGVTAYVNGDNNDAFQNVGGEYVYKLGGAELSAGANYNVDTEDFAPTAGLSFNF
jgi:hypothetical protein